MSLKSEFIEKQKIFLAEPVIGFAGVLDHASFFLPALWDWSCAEHSWSCSLIIKGLRASLPDLWGKWYEID